MTSLSDHFTLEELTRTDTGIPNVPTPRQVDRLRHLAACLEKIKAKALNGLPVIVSSGFRSEAVNRAVGGSPTSDHRNGDAADIKCPKFGTPCKWRRPSSNPASSSTSSSLSRPGCIWASAPACAARS